MTRPMTWLAALRDHPERPPVTQRMVLVSLALRMDWSTGCGFASTGQLAADADCEERTVKRATKWGRDSRLLVQTRRGHRISAGKAAASEWRLILPVDNQTQGDTGVPLGETQGDRDSDPRGQRTRPKGTPAHPHLDLSSSRPSSPLSREAERETDSDEDDDEDKPGPDAELLAGAVPGADYTDIEWAITSLQYRQHHGEIRSVRAYLRALIANGDAQALIDEAVTDRRRVKAELARLDRLDPTGKYNPFGSHAPANTVNGYVIPDDGRLASSCRSGDHGQCLWSWCECHCHAKAVTR